ncbi:MAG TPA: class I SAM-dependent methyltransferase [Anaerolineae bacterium]|nr:class I SAM-dependent methyltransferase [Anaerolineae bacterium]
MTVFGGYARYYDLLYRDKDYRGETEFVERLIRLHAPGARRVLELGCGTGIHGIMLAEQGYEIVGLDRSEDMLSTAAQRVAGLSQAIAKRVRFIRGDVRDFQVEGRFDAVVSLFHVLSYQLTNDDLRAVFSQVKDHLAPGGVFIFDCWYGPAVLTDRPTVRVKRFADASTSVTRIAVPTLHPNLNRVDIQYQLFVKDNGSGTVEELSELHQMRYLFRPELELLAEAAGLRIESCGAWMSDREPDFSTWYVHFVVKQRD